MGVLLDIVPNHMAASPHNPYWMDVLEFGRDCRCREAVRHRSGTPIASTAVSCSRCSAMPCRPRLEAGAIALRADYGERPAARRHLWRDRLPALRHQRAELLTKAARAEPALSDAAAAWAELADGNLAPSVIARARATLGIVLPSGREALAATLASADLAAVLEAQHWRLAWWRTAADDLNYRRFFNITELIGVRVEDPEVFAETHRPRPRRWCAPARSTACASTTSTGSLDPARYLRRSARRRRPRRTDLHREDTGAPARRCAIGRSMAPPAMSDWPTSMACSSRRPAGTLSTPICAPATCSPAPRPNGSPSAKRDVLQASLATEIDALARLARDGLDEAMRAADLTETALRRGVVALLVHCPVYRSYATADAHSAATTRRCGTRSRAAIAHSEDPLTTPPARAPAGAGQGAADRRATACSGCASSSFPARPWPRASRTPSFIAT